MRQGRAAILVCTAVAATMLAAAALAASQADKASCVQDSRDRKIAACTRIIDDPDVTAGDRVVAFVHRGVGYGMGQPDLAIADFRRRVPERRGLRLVDVSHHKPVELPECLAL